MENTRVPADAHYDRHLPGIGRAGIRRLAVDAPGAVAATDAHAGFPVAHAESFGYASYASAT
jgi:hypothetical protein